MDISKPKLVELKHSWEGKPAHVLRKGRSRRCTVKGMEVRGKEVVMIVEFNEKVQGHSMQRERPYSPNFIAASSYAWRTNEDLASDLDEEETGVPEQHIIANPTSGAVLPKLTSSNLHLEKDDKLKKHVLWAFDSANEFVNVTPFIEDVPL
jgi:hypothetical protein